MENIYQCPLSTLTFFFHCIYITLKNPIPFGGSDSLFTSLKLEAQRNSTSLSHLSPELMLFDLEVWNFIRTEFLAACGEKGSVGGGAYGIHFSFLSWHHL